MASGATATSGSVVHRLFPGGLDRIFMSLLRSTAREKSGPIDTT
jgi:hypothetical protein